MQGTSDFLKRRAKEFWQRAQEDFEKHRFNLSALDLEQAVQLWMKHLIFVKADDFPKMHYLNRLIEELSIVYDNQDILNFYHSHSLEFRSLEDAYITTRYFEREFTKEEVESLKEFTASLIKFLEKQTGEKFI